METETKRAEFLANFKCPSCGRRTFCTQETVKARRTVVVDLNTKSGSRTWEEAGQRIDLEVDNPWYCEGCGEKIDPKDAIWLDGNYFKISWTDSGRLL